jgi:hypothetical protein
MTDDPCNVHRKQSALAAPLKATTCTILLSTLASVCFLSRSVHGDMTQLKWLPMKNECVDLLDEFEEANARDPSVLYAISCSPGRCAEAGFFSEIYGIDPSSSICPDSADRYGYKRIGKKTAYDTVIACFEMCVDANGNLWTASADGVEMQRNAAGELLGASGQPVSTSEPGTDAEAEGAAGGASEPEQEKALKPMSAPNEVGRSGSRSNSTGADVDAAECVSMVSCKFWLLSVPSAAVLGCLAMLL